MHIRRISRMPEKSFAFWHLFYILYFMLRLELKYFVATKTRSGIKLNSAEYVAFEQLTRALCMSIFGFAVNVSRVRNKQYRFCTTGERSWFYDFLWFNLAETGQWQTCKKFGFRILRSRRSKQKVISIRFSRSYTVYTIHTLKSKQCFWGFDNRCAVAFFWICE